MIYQKINYVSGVLQHYAGFGGNPFDDLQLFDAKWAEYVQAKAEHSITNKLFLRNQINHSNFKYRALMKCPLLTLYLRISGVYFLIFAISFCIIVIIIFGGRF